MICPIIEYGAIIWSPYSQSLINNLEAVQRKTARKTAIANYTLQVINIHKTYGKYVPQKTNYTLWNGSIFLKILICPSLIFSIEQGSGSVSESQQGVCHELNLR